MIKEMNDCTLCPRNCHADRTQKKGYCGAGVLPKIALASVHHWEEPCISGTNGSGTIFFSQCNLNCIFCQNHTISKEGIGKEITVEALSQLFLKQQKKGVHNLNLVSPGHYLPQIRQAILLAKEMGLTIPIVYNTNSYEKAEALKTLEGLIDVYLPDLKYFYNGYAQEFSHAPHYFAIASKAILEMFRQTGPNQFDQNGMMTKGVLIRHLILPGCKEDSKKIVDWIRLHFQNQVYVSLMSQYTPMHHALEHKQLKRKLTAFEYQRVTEYFLKSGLEHGFIQKKTSASSSFTPRFDLSGLE